MEDSKLPLTDSSAHKRFSQTKKVKLSQTPADKRSLLSQSQLQVYDQRVHAIYQTENPNIRIR